MIHAGVLLDVCGTLYETCIHGTSVISENGHSTWLQHALMRHHWSVFAAYTSWSVCTHNVVDRDVNQLDEVADKAHDNESSANSAANIQELCR